METLEGFNLRKLWSWTRCDFDPDCDGKYTFIEELIKRFDALKNK